MPIRARGEGVGRQVGRQAGRWVGRQVGRRVVRQAGRQGGSLGASPGWIARGRSPTTHLGTDKQTTDREIPNQDPPTQRARGENKPFAPSPSF